MAYLKNKLVLHELQRKYVDFAREKGVQRGITKCIK